MAIGNTYFQFKQFRIDQELCAMKVTTDACVFGAWTPIHPHVKRVLDIGTGTGLLPLMLAQKNSDVHIDGIELVKDATRQAKANIANSPWRDRIEVMEGDVRNYPFPEKYDLIISNPPFFNNSLLGGNASRNAARHTHSLSYSDLLDVMEHHLQDDGYASILLPATETKIWNETAESRGWTTFHRLNIQHRPDAQIKRVISLVSKRITMEIIEETLIIQSADNQYSDDFKRLLRPYYLNL